ncbi:MAG: hypothetical protein GY737_26605 [Desulfobacteraceae bacterium]|nr:hypothetical protein [Desulfobacteraceae bacterium]
MKRKMRESFWWPGMDKDIEQFTKMCFPCQRSDKSMSKQQCQSQSDNVNVNEKTIPVMM